MTERTKTLQEIPPDVMSTLAVRWMNSFEAAARAQNRLGVMQLFSEASLITGAQKDGPLDHILSKNFHFESKQSKMIPQPPTVLVVCPWHAISEVVGGPTRKGDATLYLCIEKLPNGKQRFVCYHAHFSLC